VFDATTKTWKSWRGLAPHWCYQGSTAVVLYGEALSRLTDGLVGVTAYRMVAGSGACLAFHLEPQPASVGPRTEADYKLIVLRQERKKELARVQLYDDAWLGVLCFLSGPELSRVRCVSNVWNSPKRAGNQRLFQELLSVAIGKYTAEAWSAQFAHYAEWSQVFAVHHLVKGGLTPRDIEIKGLTQQRINSIFDIFHMDLNTALIDAKYFVTTEEGREVAEAEGAYAFHEMSSLTQSGLKDMFDSSIRCALGAKFAPKKQRQCCVQ